MTSPSEDDIDRMWEGSKSRPRKDKEGNIVYDRVTGEPLYTKEVEGVKEYIIPRITQIETSLLNWQRYYKEQYEKDPSQDEIDGQLKSFIHDHLWQMRKAQMKKPIDIGNQAIVNYGGKWFLPKVKEELEKVLEKLVIIEPPKERKEILREIRFPPIPEKVRAVIPIEEGDPLWLVGAKYLANENRQIRRWLERGRTFRGKEESIEEYRQRMSWMRTPEALESKVYREAKKWGISLLRKGAEMIKEAILPSRKEEPSTKEEVEKGLKEREERVKRAEEKLKKAGIE